MLESDYKKAWVIHAEGETGMTCPSLVMAKDFVACLFDNGVKSFSVTEILLPKRKGLQGDA